MTGSGVTAPDVVRLELDGELTIYTAHESKERLLDALADGAPLEVGLSGVTDLDTSGLQLLLLARREAERVGTPLSLVEAGEPVRAVLALAGLTRLLTEPAVDEPAVVAAPAPVEDLSEELPELEVTW